MMSKRELPRMDRLTDGWGKDVLMLKNLDVYAWVLIGVW